MLIMFLLGFNLDTFEIIFIVVPITTPFLLALDVDSIWLGVLVGVNLRTSFLTPPFGFALFYLRDVAPADLPTSAIYKGIIPFVVLQIVAIAILFAVPQLIARLPQVIQCRYVSPFCRAARSLHAPPAAGRSGSGGCRRQICQFRATVR